MSIPSKAKLTHELLLLLNTAKEGGMEAQLVYKELAKKFPELTFDELNVPYQSDQYGSKWKTSVRSIKEQCKQDGFISRSTARGYWALTDRGHNYITEPLDIPGLG